MNDFFTFLETHTNGILMLLLILVVIAFIINFLAKTFSFGRYKDAYFATASESKVSYIIVQFFIRLIDDFRHFLAMTIVVIFTFLILFSMMATDDFSEKMEALKLVIASLGGLLGSIIGYYFGESAAKNSLANLPVQPSLVNNGNVEPVEEEDPATEEIVAAPTPEILRNDPSGDV